VSPVVVVTATRRTDGGRERVALNTAYVKALLRAGVVPLAVPPLLEPGMAADVLRASDGLVLTGGEDVAPDRYGAAPHPALGEVDPARDAVEIALIHEARAQGKPILAICRGIQILNVALGGTLYQDLPSERPGPVDHRDPDGRHSVQIAPGSLLAETVGATAIHANSRHHQAIRDLAAPLRITARADDGVIEAVEFVRPPPGEPWMLAVQWHPEDLIETTLFAGFAQALTGAAAAAR
jgi:putative glutamine amidotransferase